MTAHQQELDFYQGDLLEKICASDTLRKAFKSVKANKGAPGIDGKSIEEFEQNLEEEIFKLRQEVLNWKYKPCPVKRVEIPKPNGKGVRLLGIPIIKDRVLHMAIKEVLEEILDPTFSPNSYGFRPGKNQRQAVEAAQKIVKSGKEYVVDIDLSKFFDRINHDRLIHRLGLYVHDKRVLRLIGMILRGGVIDKDGLKRSKEGSVQGSPLSPLLSNLVLDELDKELEKRGLEFCRFADDCNIFVRSPRAGERVMARIRDFIEKKLKLKVNEEKSQVAKADQVKFLGMTIVNGLIAISKAAYTKAMERVKELIPRGSHKTMEKSMEEVNRWYTGWGNYFKMSQYPAQFQSIEARIRRRFRARFVKQCKRKRSLHKKLKRLGVSNKQSAKFVWSPGKTWKKSHNRAISQALPNSFFTERLGQKIFSTLQLEGWEPINRRVKLT